MRMKLLTLLRFHGSDVQQYDESRRLFRGGMQTLLS